MVTEFFDDSVMIEYPMTRRERKQARKKNITSKARSNRGQKAAPKTPAPMPVLEAIYPKTENQMKMFSEYNQGKALNITGLAGTGKSFVALYLALFDVMNGVEPYTKVMIIRSAAPGRNQGFLPGSKKEKEAVFEAPYIGICAKLFNNKNAYEDLKKREVIEFESTSYMRGITIENSIIIFDEAQNATGQEIDSIITRVGDTSRLIMISDYRQSDLKFSDEREGYFSIQKILKTMKNVGHIEMTVDDVVRSGFVKDYLIAKDKLGYNAV